ncbi:SDR family NAD(P)-dependent oxidoreductase [Thermoactinomyces sp. AMNI-1]|uniref:SDR family NAD(P)-dependent oxidoreductase n=2 Tax=Thermoactinomyces mirandus TaxID=2756294 RepID=A0A7W1XPP4_9BACL|nr:SDR family NAD(P)-dependent oxidoreductase [Thermoactinomyces mirandus]
MSDSWLHLEGKVAIVTGGASGIGRHITNELISNGVKVVVADLNVKEGVKLTNPYYLKCDVTKKESVDRMVAKTVELFGSVDILINNAGGNDYGFLDLETLDEKVGYTNFEVRSIMCPGCGGQSFLRH